MLGHHHLAEQEMEAVLTLEVVFAELVVAVSHSFLAVEKRSRVLAAKCHTRSFPVVAFGATVFVLSDDPKAFDLV